jgi:pectin methylesterase-like acyl-CoA thioesterase
MILIGCAAALNEMSERSRVLNITAGDSYKKAWQGQALLLFLLAAAGAARAQTISACIMLSSPTGHDDTGQIQFALNTCSPGKAVVLKGASFESRPLILPRGVTLFIDRSATLRASRNLRDYDLKPGSCGAPPAGQTPTCKPFIYSYQAACSGVQGAGIIDGQGTAPVLVSSYESQGFTLKGVTLRNASGIHAAIYKTIGFTLSDVRMDSPSGAGLLLSNAVDASVSGAWIRLPGEAIALKASILGPTTGVQLRDIHVFGGKGIAIGDDVYGAVRGIHFDGVAMDNVDAGFIYNLKGVDGGRASDIRYDHVCLHNPGPRNAALPGSCDNPPYSPNPQTTFSLDLTTFAVPGKKRSLVVSLGESIQKAVDALPLDGGDITVKPGTYREVVTIRKPHVHLHGDDPDPSRTTIVFNNGALKSGGTFNSSTVFVEADDVTIDHLSLANDLGAGKGQAVALHVTGDRAIFHHLRISSAQDTLFAASRYCYGDYGPCVTARQYFADCFIEGNIDFIFGDSKAVFERCELHGVPSGSVMYTAQSKHTADQHSGYIFDHCRLTGAPRDGVISLGRSWRPFATVVFLQAQIDAPVTPDGWTEWLRFGVPTLPTAYYAEFNSTGPGANPKAREKYSHQLTEQEAAKWDPARFLAGEDNWKPIQAAVAGWTR